MTNQHPITPPPELVRQWIPAGWDCSPNTFTTLLMRIADNAALWSHDHCRSKIKAATDQELEACCELLKADGYKGKAIDLLNARRPKPPGLKEQALDALREAESSGCLYVNGRSDLIRKALEALPND